MPVLKGKRYFISYKSEDTERIGEIARKLNQMGVPMWYDYGIEKGKRWSAEINRNIDECEAVILFATKALFVYEDTYVRMEFRLAKAFSKKIYVVWLDNVTTDDVNKQIIDWYLNMTDLQGIEVIRQTTDKIAWRMVTELNLINGMPPQPPSPIYLPHAPRLNVSVGDRIPFGQYPQGADGEVQPLMWRVLAVENGRALLITDKLIEAIPYNKDYSSVTWETCTLRKWMNDEFFCKAFLLEEQSEIISVINQNPSNPEYRTRGGSATQDKIFVLNIDEANKYFHDDDDRMTAVTGYAKMQGSYVSDNYSLPGGEKTGWWWLRSPGDYGFRAAYVGNYGRILRFGGGVFSVNGSVRPALWRNLE